MITVSVGIRCQTVSIKFHTFQYCDSIFIFLSYTHTHAHTFSSHTIVHAHTILYTHTPLYTRHPHTPSHTPYSTPMSSTHTHHHHHTPSTHTNYNTTCMHGHRCSAPLPCSRPYMSTHVIYTPRVAPWTPHLKDE